MRLLDLFSGAGGAARGYQRAGFHVTGIDIKPQPAYGGDVFALGDVLTLDPAWITANFDAVHASPPCQFGTSLRSAPGTKKDHVNLIPATKLLLEATGLPWIIENVESKAVLPHMRGSVRLCGSTFGLGVDRYELRRHRLFLSNMLLFCDECRHGHGPVIGVYGGHARCRSAKHGGRGTADAWPGGHLKAASEAMGIDWMTLAELSEAIPPAYTTYLGHQLAHAIHNRRAA